MAPLVDSLRAVLRQERIEDDLPYLLSMMTAMSKVGMDLTDIILTLKDEGTFSRPTRLLLSSLVLGSQGVPLSAVLNEESKRYGGRISAFLSGLAVETIKGNVTPYLGSFTARLMTERLSEIRGGLQLEQIMSIVYSTLFLLGPMISIVVMSALGYMGASVFPFESCFWLLFLLYVPIGALLFTVPGWKREAVRRALPFVIASVLLLYLGLAAGHGPLSSGLISSAGLIFLPLGLYETRAWLREQSIDRHLPTFLRDLSLQLLSGRDFLQAFRPLAGKGYGGLSSFLRRIVNAMELGEPFTDSVRLLSRETALSQRVTTLLTVLMRRGGDVSGVVGSVSDFSWSLRVMEDERRRRQYLTIAFFYVFMLAFLMLVSSAIQILSSAIPIMRGGEALTASAIGRMLFVASMISSIATGLVAGAMTSRRIGAGGVHTFLFGVMSTAFYGFVW